MSMGDIGRQRAQYRRGLVLGLTVAESLLLILFALLLALGYVLLKRDREAQALQTQIRQLQASDRLLEAKVDVLSAMVEHKPADTFFRELVQARELQAQLRQREAQLEERERRAGRLEEVLAALQGSSDQRRRLADLAAIGAKLEEAVKAASPKTPQADLHDDIPEGIALAQAARAAAHTPEETRALLTDAARAARENATLRGQVVKLRKDLQSVGKGGDYPPCWITESGEIQYLFDIALNGSGSLTVADATPPDRILDRRSLPIPPRLYGNVSRDQFLAMTGPLLAVSNAKSCRFYVIARDRTGPTQKDLFKTLLINTVEARFYKVIRR